MEESILNALRQSAIFETLEPGELRDLLKHATPRTYTGGEVLFREGDPGESLIILSRGWVVLSRTTPARREIQIGRAGPGEVLGEMALLDSAPRSATATVLSPAWILELPTTRFEAMLEALDPAALKLLQQLSRVLCTRLRAVTARIESELTGSDEQLYSVTQASRASHRRDPYVSELLTPENLRQPFPELEVQVDREMTHVVRMDLPGSSRPVQRGDGRRSPPRPSSPAVKVTAPQFELAKRGGLWKILWGIKG